MSMTPLGTPPNRTMTDADFSAASDTLMSKLPTFVTEANALQTDVTARQTDVTTKQGLAATSATNAATSETNAGISANAAQAIANAPQYTDASTTSITVGTGAKVFTISSGKSYGAGMTLKIANGVNFMTGTVTSYVGTTLTMSIATISGSGTFASWTVSVAGASLYGSSVPRFARGSNTILAASDAGTLIDITSGTFTQTLTAAATLGASWAVWYRNSGSGDITLDPSASELIDGLTSFIMYSGECRLITCNGTAFTSVVISSFSKRFTSTGTFTKPPGYSSFRGMAWSGGSSGQRTNNAALVSVGGGGGGCGEFMLLASAVGATVTVTIGAGGLAVSTVANGNVGGNTTFGTLFSVYAHTTFRVGGSVLADASSGGFLATGYEAPNSTGSSNSVWGGLSPSSNGTVAAGVAVYGAGCGGVINSSAVVFAAGTSIMGGNGGAASSAGNGTAGVAPGGGGGATQTGTSSGAGAAGELRISGVV